MENYLPTTLPKAFTMTKCTVYWKINILDASMQKMLVLRGRDVQRAVISSTLNIT